MIRQIELHYLANPDPAAPVRAAHRRRRRRGDAGGRGAPRARRARDRGAQRQARPGRARARFTSCTASRAGTRPSGASWAGSASAASSRSSIACSAATRTRATRATSATRRGSLGIRFVITLDSDTQLPMGRAHRLVGLLAHPLNRARRSTPRPGASSRGTRSSSRASRRRRRARARRGSRGSSRATSASTSTRTRSPTCIKTCSAPGIYVGKGIYDVDAFMRSVEGRVPENALVSHDLFEGVHGRTALATDIVLFEDYPSQLRRVREAHAPLGARRLAAPAVAVSRRCPRRRGSRLPNPLVAHRSLEDRRQPAPQPDEPAAARAPRARLDLAARRARWSGRSVALVLLLAPLLPALVRDRRQARSQNLGRCGARARVPRARGGGRRRRDRPRGRANGDHAQAPAAVDLRRRTRRPGSSERRRARCSGGRCSAVPAARGGDRGARRLGHGPSALVVAAPLLAGSGASRPRSRAG